MYKVIIADDHFVVTDGIRKILESEKEFRVIDEAADGEELIRKSEKSKFDLLITDLSMPKIDGLDAIRTIKKKKKNLKSILLTMYTRDIDIYNAIKVGADGMIGKDALKDELINGVKTVLNGEKYFLGKSNDELKSIVKKNNIIKEAYSQEGFPLTKRELEVMEGIGEGLSSKKIAEKLEIEKRTVDAHRANIMRKLDINSLSELIGIALKILNAKRE